MGARKRTISPDLWTDEKVLQLPMEAVAFYIGLISQADDEGRLKWSVPQLHARIAGGRPEVTTEMVGGWMSAIVASGLVKTYTIDEQKYAHHPAWRGHQYVNKPQPSSIPSPPVPHRSGRSKVAVHSQQVPLVSVSESSSLSDSLSDSGSVSGVQGDGRSPDDDGGGERSVTENSRKRLAVTDAEPSTPFSDPRLEGETVAFLGLCASKNGDNRLAASRITSIRSEIIDRVAQYGAAAMLYGLREATTRSKSSIGYAVACARDYTPERVTRYRNVTPIGQKRFESERLDEPIDESIYFTGETA